MKFGYIEQAWIFTDSVTWEFYLVHVYKKNLKTKMWLKIARNIDDIWYHWLTNVTCAIDATQTRYLFDYVDATCSQLCKWYMVVEMDASKFKLLPI